MPFIRIRIRNDRPDAKRHVKVEEPTKEIWEQQLIMKGRFIVCRPKHLKT